MTRPAGSLEVTRMRKKVVEAILDRENSLAYILQWYGESHSAQLKNAVAMGEAQRAMDSLRVSGLHVVETICGWRRKLVRCAVNFKTCQNTNSFFGYI
jgi:hypothetical protein